MKISIIVAMDEDRGIGIDNKLPWKLSDDLRRFKKLTMGHPIIMGRKTFESIGKPLPGRINIIVTRKKDYRPPGCVIANSHLEAIDLARSQKSEEVFVIGGEEIYRTFLEFTDKIYLTIVHTRQSVDTFFPNFDMDQWLEKCSKTVPADESNEFTTTFKILKRPN
jgi:dihydrofolate reductase